MQKMQKNEVIASVLNEIFLFFHFSKIFQFFFFEKLIFFLKNNLKKKNTSTHQRFFKIASHLHHSLNNFHKISHIYFKRYV